MRPHWKFAFIVASLSFVAMTGFFIYDYYLARERMNITYVENLRLGANLPRITHLIASQVAVLVEESAKDRMTLRMDIRDALARIRQNYAVLMENVLEVYVVDLDGSLLGYLNDQGEKVLPQPFPVTEEVIKQIANGGTYIGDLSYHYYGQRASVLMEPYYRVRRMIPQGDVWVPQDQFALVQVVYSTEKVWRLVNGWRMRHLLYVLGVGLLLPFVIVTVMTWRLITRPLQQIIAALERAEEGDFEIQFPVSYSNNLIARLLVSLHRMLGKIRAAQREHITELGTLAAGLAHEIRNPLNYIGMTADYLKRRLANAPLEPEIKGEVNESLDTLLEEVTAIDQITRRFINLTRPLVLDRKPTDIHQLLDGVIGSMTVALQKARVEVIRRYGNVPPVSVDPAKLRQALVNLIQNATQAMADRGGRLYLNTGVQQGLTGRWLTLSIRDTGPGMPPHVRERIFEAYYTTRENEGGLGLGLTITRQIIQAHEGRIEVRSQEGMGTEFTIRIPIFDEGTMNDQPPEA